MAARNFRKLGWAARMRRQGSESRDGENLLPDVPAKRPVSKAELRAQAEACIQQDTLITKRVKCTCGHEALVRLPMHQAGEAFRCASCDRCANER